MRKLWPMKGGIKANIAIQCCTWRKTKVDRFIENM